jgi:hypothetical protein
LVGLILYILIPYLFLFDKALLLLVLLSLITITNNKRHTSYYRD